MLFQYILSELGIEALATPKTLYSFATWDEMSE